MSASLARAAILILAAALRLWRLDQNGFDNEYYAAAVRSMAAGWHAFLYNAFDPAGFVSVDKPPVALWIQALAVGLFGFHGITVLLPQVVEGVAAVALLDHLVRRRFGTGAGLLAALFLAVTPVSVATDRSNNTESCLVLVLLLAAVGLRVAWTGERRWLAFAVPGALLLTVAWQLYVEGSTIGLALPPGDWRRWLAPTLVVGGLAAVGGLLVPALAPQTSVRRVMAPACVAATLLALLVMPSAWALSSVLVKGVLILPSADLTRPTPGDRAAGARDRGRAA